MPHHSRQEEDAVPVRRILGILAGFATLFAVTGAVPAQAQVDVFGHATLIGTTYHYSFDVSNNTADEVILVSARLPDHTFVISNPAAPDGFQLVYSEADGDGNNKMDGYLNFLPDGGSASTFGPFSVTSPFTFDADELFAGFKLEGLNSNGDPVSGTVSVAPEPGALALLLPGLLSVGLVVRRRIK